MELHYPSWALEVQIPTAFCMRCTRLWPTSVIASTSWDVGLGAEGRVSGVVLSMTSVLGVRMCHVTRRAEGVALEEQPVLVLVDVVVVVAGVA